MGKHDQSPETRPSARRKLLRASFAVPVVLAVHNGAALAAKSNALRCAVNATLDPQFPAAAPAADSWTRTVVYNNPTDNKKYVKVSDLLAIATAGGLGFVTPSGSNATDWVEYVAGGSYVYATPVGTPAPTAASPVILAAVLFDSGGAAPNVIRVVGFVQPNQTSAATGTSAVSASCWSSLMP